MKRFLIKALVLGLAGSSGTAGLAQYKWQTPDGRSVYSDLPPQPSQGSRVVESRGWSAPAVNGAPDAIRATELPYDLRVVARQLPVVLYTAADCAPCLSARRHLVGRGIPFAEKTVATSADFEAFKTRSPAGNSFPVLAVGPDSSIGFEEGAYDKLLDGAGYPRTSRLPPGYQHAQAEPLVPPPAPRPIADVPRALPNPPAAASGSPGVTPGLRF